MSSNPAHQDKMAGLTQADQQINQTPEDVSNAASGHKANISNPSTPCTSPSLPPSFTPFMPKLPTPSTHPPPFPQTFSALTPILTRADTSQASKEASKQALKDLGGEKAFYGKQGAGE